ncbi:hypothetical protein C8R45DRAFT_967967 [Mycena sanguinolenta]|nr:hypothetical protein C8R45DRAFT_967967 [Mycena sanguinolenta]
MAHGRGNQGRHFRRTPSDHRGKPLARRRNPSVLQPSPTTPLRVYADADAGNNITTIEPLGIGIGAAGVLQQRLTQQEKESSRCRAITPSTDRASRDEVFVRQLNFQAAPRGMCLFFRPGPLPHPTTRMTSVQLVRASVPLSLTLKTRRISCPSTKSDELSRERGCRTSWKRFAVNHKSTNLSMFYSPRRVIQLAKSVAEWRGTATVTAQLTHVAAER